jgi:hypothetical protein
MLRLWQRALGARSQRRFRPLNAAALAPGRGPGKRDRPGRGQCPHRGPRTERPLSVPVATPPPPSLAEGPSGSSFPTRTRSGSPRKIELGILLLASQPGRFRFSNMNPRLPISLLPSDSTLLDGGAIRSISVPSRNHGASTPDSRLTPFGVGVHDPSAAEAHLFETLTHRSW